MKVAGCWIVGLALAFAGSAVVAPRGTHSVTFKGSATCSISGSITATPPLTTNRAAHTLSLHASLSHCTGNTSENGVTITGGVLTAKGMATGSCTSLTAGTQSGTVSWTAGGAGAALTKQSFSNASVSASSNTGIITVKLPGSGGTSKATGSFAGSKSTLTAVVDQTESMLTSECLGSGVSKLTFTGKNGKSSITVG